MNNAITEEALINWVKKWGPNEDWIKVDHKSFAKKFLTVLNKNYRKLSDISSAISAKDIFNEIYAADCIFIYPGKNSQYLCSQAVDELTDIITLYIGFRPYIQYGREMLDPVHLRNYFYVDKYPDFSNDPPTLYGRNNDIKYKEKISLENEKEWKDVSSVTLNNLREILKEKVRKTFAVPLPALEEITDGVFGKWVIKNTNSKYKWLNDKDKRMRPTPYESKEFIKKLFDLPSDYPRNDQILPILVPNWMNERVSISHPLKEIHEVASAILEIPGGLRDRARRATITGFSPDTKTKQSLCNDLESSMYRAELYELAKEIGLPVIKATKKNELCKLLAEYIGN
jgi:hypothetical protein